MPHLIAKIQFKKNLLHMQLIMLIMLRYSQIYINLQTGILLSLQLNLFATSLNVIVSAFSRSSSV